MVRVVTLWKYYKAGLFLLEKHSVKYLPAQPCFHPSTSPAVFLVIHLTVHLPIHLPSSAVIQLSLSICSRIHLSVRPSIHPSLYCPSVCPTIPLYIHPSSYAFAHPSPCHPSNLTDLPRASYVTSPTLAPGMRGCLRRSPYLPSAVPLP